MIGVDNVINLKHDFSCSHNKFVLDEKLNTVECGICGKELNPIWVLKKISHSESRLNRTLDLLIDKIEKCKNKLRCKCQHCKKMTRIEK